MDLAHKDKRMATVQYTPPPTPTSVHAVTITQTLTRLGGPVTTTFVTLTTLTLSKPTPTSDQSPQARPKSGLSPSAIGAIVGSLLGFILLIALIYFCCFSTPNDDSEPESDPIRRPVRFGPDDDIEIADAHVHQTRPVTIRCEDDTEMGLKSGQYEVVTKGDDFALSRPRRKRRAPMNRARSPSE